MKKIILHICFKFQLFVLKMSYLAHREPKVRKDWLVAGFETASMLQNLAKALPSSTSVNFASNKFYNFSYDVTLYSTNIFQLIWNVFYVPFLFGSLLKSHNGVIYLGAAGFVTAGKDGRASEFAFVKSLNKSLICYFVGSEIRSFKLLNQFAETMQRDVITTYQHLSNPGVNSDINEDNRKKLGFAATKYADHIFNPSVDQMAYIDRYTHPCLYFLPDNMFKQNLSKFSNVEEFVICHGPSSPIIKGTQLVRAAIKKLKMEGYKIRYVELINMPHSELLNNLEVAHIVLNEFYAFVPGIFAAEAMAHSCAVLTSADPAIETSLGIGFDDSWVVTPYWLIYDKLKCLLDNPESISLYAAKGYDFAKRHYKYNKASEKFRMLVSQ